MASVLILSDKGLGIPLAKRLAKEGHITKVWFMDGKSRLDGRNPSTVRDPFGMLEQYDLVLGMCPGSGKYLEICTQAGKPVIGGGNFHDKITFDEDYKRRVMLKFLMDGGTKAQVQGWFDGTSFTQIFTRSTFYKRFLEGERGPETSGEGCLLVKTDEEGEVETVKRFETFLQKLDYIGPFSIQGDKINTYMEPLSLYAFTEMLKGPLFNFLWDLVEKRASQVMNEDVAISLKISAPPYPYGVGGELKVEVPEPAEKHVWIEGEVGYISARGTSIREARRRVYRTVKNIVKDQSIQYRRDIGEDA